jgi:hypothetical protein
MVIYNEFITKIVDDIGIEQVDTPVAGPVGHLLAKFVTVGKKDY